MVNLSELARLVEKIILVMHDFIKQATHDLSYTKGEICFIALEYFYDGEAIDIGLRIGLQEERVRLQKESNDKNYDIREDGGNFDYYVRILDHERVKPHADAFLMFLKSYGDEENRIIYSSIKDLTEELTKLMKKTNWVKYARMTEDFVVLGPYEYD